jgi:glycosyltransferase involved in cell wall biosynthesis
MELHVVTDVPTAYRIHEFRHLGRSLREQGSGLRVTFLAKSQRHRAWALGSGSFGFQHSFGSGPTVYLRHDLPVHINPVLWLRTVSGSKGWLLLGGSWYQPAVLAASYSARPGHLLLWSENTERMTFSASSAVERIRRNLYSKFDGFVVPGSRAAAYVEMFSHRPRLRLPNVVDESLFRDAVDSARSSREEIRSHWGVHGERLLFWPARLVPVKGILPFLAILRKLRSDFSVIIAGTGALERQARRFVDLHGMSHVRLVGRLSERRMIEAYAAADALLLPSLFEPYGLSTVEALWAGLPLIVSDRVGSVPEVLESDANGWSFDPSDAVRIENVLDAAVEAGPAELARMGSCSREIAQDRFDSRAVSDSFVEQLISGFPA